ncbi:PQQ-binding-like beta-propeller repeat protein [Streptomyces sp. NPDC047014]|uniref:PQQ-binding-like beta-propeller repeat protein n=1 Tax=Streptomyces sp. NPDC047014 TaxID=3155736 RepID=UPI0033F286EC
METHPHRAELTERGSWSLGGWVGTVRLRDDRIAAAVAPGRLALGTWGGAGPESVVEFDSPVTDIAVHPGGWLLSLEAGGVALVDDRGEVLRRRDGAGGWRLAAGPRGHFAVDRNGSVSLIDHRLRPLWTHTGPSAWSICPAPGLIALPSTEGSVDCRAAGTGELLWRHTEPHPVYGCAAVDDGFAVGTAEGALLLLDRSGTVLRRRATHAVRLTASHAGGLLAACVDGTLRSYDTGLTERWRFATGSWAKGVEVRAGTVAVASADHHLYLLDDDGRELGRHRAGHTVLSVARDERRLAAGSADGRLYFLTSDLRSPTHV